MLREEGVCLRTKVNNGPKKEGSCFVCLSSFDLIFAVIFSFFFFFDVQTSHYEIFFEYW